MPYGSSYWQVIAAEERETVLLLGDYQPGEAVNKLQKLSSPPHNLSFFPLSVNTAIPGTNAEALCFVLLHGVSYHVAEGRWLPPPQPRVLGVSHHLQFLQCWGSNPGLWTVWASTLRPKLQAQLKSLVLFFYSLYSTLMSFDTYHHPHFLNISIYYSLWFHQLCLSKCPFSGLHHDSYSFNSPPSAIHLATTAIIITCETN